MSGEIPEPAALTVERLERHAAAGYGLPDGLRPAEQLLFLSLRTIYRDYRNRLLTREQAGLEKQKVMEQYRRYSRMQDNAARQCRAFVDTARRTEPLRLAYCRALADGAPDSELLPLACRIAQAATGDKTIAWERKRT